VTTEPNNGARLTFVGIGPFYVVFGEDAVIVARELGLKLSWRGRPSCFLSRPRANDRFQDLLRRRFAIEIHEELESAKATRLKLEAERRSGELLDAMARRGERMGRGGRRQSPSGMTLPKKSLDALRWRLRCSSCGARPIDVRPDWREHRAHGAQGGMQSRG
jgi:hypothetical protein